MALHLAGRGIAAGINIYDPSDVASFNAGYDYGITYFGYPPFVAAVLGQLRSLSTDDVFLLLSMLNYFALLFCGACMYLLLVRYGIPRTAGALGVLASLLVSVPVTNTLVNSQVNLWVLALILVAVLFHRSIPMLSAFTLALATMLKVTPILMAGLFVLRCEWKWLVLFVLSLSVLFLGTVALYPLDYWMEYVRLALRFGVLMEPTHMRDNSFDALIVHTFQVLGIRMLELRKWLVLALKVGFGAWVSKLIVCVVRRGTFVAKGNEDAFALNGLPLFMVMMTMVRPMVWPHHFVFLALPVLVTLAAAREPRTLGLLLLAYASLFLIPVFDLYPLSLHRLAAVILYVYCVGLVTKQDITKPTAIERLASVLSSK